jgi:beta-lactam-binding protein with PASTA domain
VSPEDAAGPRRSRAASQGQGDGKRTSLFSALARQDWWLALATAIFVGVLIWFGRSVRDFLQPNMQTVSLPALVGETESDAMDEVKRLHLHADIVAREASDLYPLGVVMRQDPTAGSQVRQGRRISLVVSRGVQLVVVPDLRYQSMREVGLDLSHVRLSVGKVKAVGNEDVPAGRVVAQDPAPLTNVRQGSAINLSLSKGPPEVVTAPEFVGMDISDARDSAKRAKVQLGQIIWTPFGAKGPARGVVVRQAPGPGARLDPFERVSLQVSAGPNVYGYLVRQVRTMVTVPDNTDDPKRMRIDVRDANGTWTVFDGYAQPRQKLDFTLTVVGSAQLDSYVDGVPVSTTTLGVEPTVIERGAQGGERGVGAADRAQDMSAPNTKATP